MVVQYTWTAINSIKTRLYVLLMYTVCARITTALVEATKPNPLICFVFFFFSFFKWSKKQQHCFSIFFIYSITINRKARNKCDSLYWIAYVWVHWIWNVFVIKAIFTSVVIYLFLFSLFCLLLLSSGLSDWLSLSLLFSLSIRISILK